jgi:tetratricopeptide (TPR) repeat protein
MIPALLFLLYLLPSPPPNEAREGDAEFVRMDYARAKILYTSTLASARDSAAILWRLARLSVCSGDVTKGDEREGCYREAVEYARRCVRADSNLAQGHTWLAASLGNVAMFEGSKTKVRLSNEIKYELDRALALDSTDDVAYSILGTFYLALGNISWIERQLANIFLGSLPPGGYQEAEVALRRAVSLAPAVMRHWFELGMVYVAENRDKDAREAFSVASQLPEGVASDVRRKQRALEWLNKISKD